MIKSIRIVFATMFLLANCAFANQLHFEIQMPNVNSYPVYPGLDLNQVEKIKVRARVDSMSPMPVVERIEFKFQNASNLIATNFKKDGYTYRAIVNGAWVFKQIIVEYDETDLLSPSAPFHIRAFVVEHSNNINNTSFAHGAQLFDINGHTLNTTPNKLADSTSIVVDNKRLTLKLMQRPTDSFDGIGFKVDTQWLGRGERTIYIPAPFPQSEFSRWKAVSLKVEVHTDPSGQDFHTIVVGYEDETGYQSETMAEDLRNLLNQVYP